MARTTADSNRVTAFVLQQCYGVLQLLQEEETGGWPQKSARVQQQGPIEVLQLYYSSTTLVLQKEEAAPKSKRDGGAGGRGGGGGGGGGGGKH